MADNLPSFTTELVKEVCPAITLSDTIIDGQVIDIDEQYGAALLAAYKDSKGSLLAANAVGTMLYDLQGNVSTGAIVSQSSPNGASVTYDMTKVKQDPREFIDKFDTQYILSDLTAPNFAMVTFSGGPTEAQVKKGEFEGSNDVNLTNRSIIW